MTERLKQLEMENEILKSLLLEKSLPNMTAVNQKYFLDVYREWLETKKDEIQRSTYFEYQRIYNTYILPYWDSQQLLIAEITPQHIEKYYKFLRNKYQMSNNSIIRHHANLHTCFKYAYEKDYITSMMMDKVKRPKVDIKQDINYYSIDELVELFAAAKDTNIYTPILLASLLGLRRSELLALKWDAFNFKNGTITIKRKMTRDKEMSKDVVSRSLKNSSSNRTLVIPDFLICHLDELKKNRSTARNQNYLEFVCIDKSGKLPTLNMITNRFRAFINKEGFRKIRFHDLRHSCASMLLSLGYPMKDIQEWLGHSNYSTTANIYTHIDLEDKKRIALKLNEIFKG